MHQRQNVSAPTATWSALHLEWLVLMSSSRRLYARQRTRDSQLQKQLWPCQQSQWARREPGLPRNQKLKMLLPVAPLVVLEEAAFCCKRTDHVLPLTFPRWHFCHFLVVISWSVTLKKNHFYGLPFPIFRTCAIIFQEIQTQFFVFKECIYFLVIVFISMLGLLGHMQFASFKKSPTALLFLQPVKTGKQYFS